MNGVNGRRVDGTRVDEGKTEDERGHKRESWKREAPSPPTLITCSSSSAPLLRSLLLLPPLHPTHHSLLSPLLCVQAWGWVQEMYGFTIAVWLAGIKRVDLFMNMMAQPPWDEQLNMDEGRPFHIIHYTYGMDYKLTGGWGEERDVEGRRGEEGGKWGGERDIHLKGSLLVPAPSTAQSLQTSIHFETPLHCCRRVHPRQVRRVAVRQADLFGAADAAALAGEPAHRGRGL
jgi:hypothetical protein